MKVHSRRIGNVVVAQLVGEIDTVDSEGLADTLAALVDAQPESLVLDFASVTYIASIGLSLLLQLARDLRKAKRTLVIAAVTPAVKTVLDTVHLGAAIPIEPTVEAALARLQTAVPA